MQTVIITNPIFDTNVSSFHYESSFPMLPYGKKVYTIRDNQLVATVCHYSIFLKEEGNGEGVYICYSIATRPGKKFLSPVSRFNTFYASVEDYNLDAKNTIRYQSRLLTDLLSCRGYCLDGWPVHSVKIKGYKAEMGGLRCSQVNMRMDKVWYDEDGFHYEESAYNRENGYYKNESDAVRAAKITDVVEFTEIQ